MAMQRNEVKRLHTVPQTNLAHHLSTIYLNMQPRTENQDQYPPHFNTYNSNTTLLINPQIHHHQAALEFSSNTSSSSLSDKNDPNSTEAEKQTYMISIINHERERKMKRLISNRESARRSRMRKRKQLEEVQLQLVQIQDMYHNLTEKFINLLETNHQVLQENSMLKQEVSLYRNIVIDTPAQGSTQFYV